MLGLRTQETNKFILFFELVQEMEKSLKLRRWKAKTFKDGLYLFQKLMNLKKYGKITKRMMNMLIFTVGPNGLIIRGKLT